MAKVSTVWKWNQFPKEAAAKKDKRQKPAKKPYTIPGLEERVLLAKLVLEESLETIGALGCQVDRHTYEVRAGISDTVDNQEKIIDGACDLIYVATGVLTAMNVPDLPHLTEVCKANDRKFPDGKIAKWDAATGKYLKPDGWKGPDHLKVKKKVLAKAKKKK